MSNEQFHVIGIVHDKYHSSTYLHFTLGSISVYNIKTDKFLTTADIVPDKFDEASGLPSRNMPVERIEVALEKPEFSSHYEPLWINFVYTPSSLHGKEHKLHRTGLVVTSDEALIPLENLVSELEKEFVSFGSRKLKPGDNYLDDNVYQVQITSPCEQAKRDKPSIRV